SSPPTVRTLRSGSVLHTFEVTVREEGQPTTSVPVVLLDGRPPDIGEGDRVAVVGRVRRRFFRAGGATVSRTEVVADEVALVRRRSTVARLVRAAVARMDAAASS